MSIIALNVHDAEVAASSLVGDGVKKHMVQDLNTRAKSTGIIPDGNSISNA